eukprot:6173500-Pleurochrysis_carterae.AAC.1
MHTHTRKFTHAHAPTPPRAQGENASHPPHTLLAVLTSSRSRCALLSRRSQDEYGKQSEYINSLTNELASVSEELNAVKEKMDARGSSMTDTSPLIKIKTAVSKLCARLAC